MNNTALEFYPAHPSGEKTHKIETTASPILEQAASFDVKALCDEFMKTAVLKSREPPEIYKNSPQNTFRGSRGK